MIKDADVWTFGGAALKKNAKKFIGKNKEVVGTWNLFRSRAVYGLAMGIRVT